MDSSQNGDLNLVKLSLKNGAIIYKNDSAMILAIENEHLEIIELLTKTWNKYIKKFYNKDFFSEDGALTLPQFAVTDDTNIQCGICKKTHKSGWTIEGELHEDYFVWINEFNAVHDKYGRVWGDFENTVYADNEEGYNDFYKNHTPHAWDYQEI